ncbi:hypothetical protein AeMF1_001429 [Aphanomyces euteiches]|nr:hypothetical protein AeMF1_001429 [Aphanomyces euteiches]
MLATWLRRQAFHGRNVALQASFSSLNAPRHKDQVPSAPAASAETVNAADVKSELMAIKVTLERAQTISPSYWRTIGKVLGQCRSSHLIEAARPIVSKAVLLDSPIGTVHNEIIRLKLHLGELTDVIALAKAKTLPLTTQTLSRILGACARAPQNLVVEGFELFELALAQGTVPPMPVYHSLFFLCAKANDVERLKQVKQHMIDSGVPMDAMCHGTCLRMECRAGDVDAALKRYNELTADGITLPAQAMNDFLEALTEADHYEDARTIVEAVQAKMPNKPWGKPVEPTEEEIKCRPLNTISYNILIKSCGKEHRMDEAFKWYEDMKSKGLKPTTTTINTMLHGVFHGKFRTINSTVVYTGLAGVGVFAGSAAYATDFSDSMGAVAITASILASLAVGIYVNPFGVKRAIYPNESGQREPIPQAILRRLDEEEHVGRAMLLWQELLGYGLQPDVATFDIFVRTCVRKRHPELAANVLLDASNPNSIVSRRKARGAIKYNFELSLDSTVRLIQALVAQNLLPLVDQLFDVALSSHRFNELIKRSGSNVRYSLEAFQTPKVTAIVLAKFLAPHLKSTMPKHAIGFDVQNCYAVLDVLDAIDPVTRSLFVMEDVLGTGHGVGMLSVNRQRLETYFKQRISLMVLGAYARVDVQVSCRFKQLDKGEPALALDFPDAHTACIDIDGGRQSSKHTAFSRVFPAETTQEEVFDHIGLPVVNELLHGYNCTILAYGQTGSGKTHTILGSKSEMGLLPRLVDSLFDSIPADDATVVSISCYEVYQERIGDLVNPLNVNLRIREDKDRGIWVEGATDVDVKDTAGAMRVVNKGISNRSTGGHLMNAASSRSHCVFVMTVSRPTQAGLKQTGKLYVVDLAGSEVVRKTAACGKRLDEAKHINKSLTALGLVINALTDGKARHVPYRDSKLTRLLQNSLGGNAKTHLILTCSSSTDNLEETLSTIRFGARAQHIQNSPHVNAEKDVSEYKQLLAQMERKIEALSAYIENLEDPATRLCPKCQGSPRPPTPTTASSCADEAGQNQQPVCCQCNQQDGELILCDGNCGQFWHRGCVCHGEVDGNGADMNNLEFYCPSCQMATDVSAMTREIGSLKDALQRMKMERDHVEERANVDKAVFDLGDQKNSDIHRQLESTIAAQDQRIQDLLYARDQLHLQVHHLKEAVQDKEREMIALKRSHQLVLDQNQAEIEIIRRTISTYERNHEVMQAKVDDLESRLAASEKQSPKQQTTPAQHEDPPVVMNRRDDEAAKGNPRQIAPQSFPMLRPSAPNSPTKSPARPVTVFDDPRQHIASRGNIQHWWSGNHHGDGHSYIPNDKTTTAPIEPNNSTEEPRVLDGTKPFKARLVGLLASLQEETDAFKDLGDKLTMEQTRQKTRQKTRRTRRFLPDIQQTDEFNQSVTPPPTQAFPDGKDS